LHNELGSRASTTISNVFNNLQQSEYLCKMGWIKRNPHGYKVWVNDVSLWANNNQMAWIMKIVKRRQEAPNFRRPVSRAPPLLDEAQTDCEELLAEIQGSAETDAGEDPAEDEQADNVTFGHKMMYPAEPNWNVISNDFVDKDLSSTRRWKEKDRLGGIHTHVEVRGPDSQTG